MPGGALWHAVSRNKQVMRVSRRGNSSFIVCFVMGLGGAAVRFAWQYTPEGAVLSLKVQDFGRALAYSLLQGVKRLADQHL